MRAIGYLRVSTEEQAQSGLGLEAQRAKVGFGAALREWELLEVIADEGVSGTVAPEDRPGMARALAMLRAGQAGALIAAKLDRTSRSAGDFARLMARARAEGWDLVLLDVQVDTTTAGGKFVAQVLAAAAELERDLIAERTRDALAAKKRRGARLGRPVAGDPEVRRQVARLRARGWSLGRIAAKLNAEGTPTTRGGKEWHAGTVRAVLRSLAADAAAAAALKAARKEAAA